ncbi:hypothetical protein CRUP_027571, partial [Coryphaenoides rupestris]
MAASNYYGFTHGAAAAAAATQYRRASEMQQAGALLVLASAGRQQQQQLPRKLAIHVYTVQQAPVVAHAVTASYSPAPVQAARPVVSVPYSAYQTHQAPPDYVYRQPEPPVPPQPTTTPQTYQVYTDTPPQQAMSQPPPPPVQQQPPIQQQQPPKQLTSASWTNAGGNMVTASAVTNAYKKPMFHQNKPQKPKGPPKQPQLHYCDICKISCAGPQEHLEGQKHKKKEAALKSGGQPGATNGPRGVQTQLRCELCDVACTGVDAYAAHIRGAKHQKVVKLHTKLGKPIPSTEPVLVSTTPVYTTTVAGKSSATATTSVSASASTLSSSSSASTAAPSAAPTAPVTGSKPAAPNAATKTTSKPASTPVAAAAPASKAEEPRPKAASRPQEPQSDDDDDSDRAQSDVQPVCNDDGKVIRFHCKLCECSFNDPNAKDMHLKGRRHRLQYKKKVNPELPVEIKPSNRARKLQEGQAAQAEAEGRAEETARRRAAMALGDECTTHHHVVLSSPRRYEEDMYWRRVEEDRCTGESRGGGCPPAPDERPGMPVPPLLPCVRRPDSPDDRHIMAKHSTIYPVEEELQAVQRIVSHSERALKLVSDSLLEKEAPAPAPAPASRSRSRSRSRSCSRSRSAPAPDPAPAPAPASEDGEEKSAETAGRLLKGVMRVGILAKGLLLHGDRNVELILLTAKKPTASLLESIVQQLPKELA